MHMPEAYAKHGLASPPWSTHPTRRCTGSSRKTPVYPSTPPKTLSNHHDEETAQSFTELTELGLGASQGGEIWRQLMTVNLSFFRSETSQRLRAQGYVEALLRTLERRGIPVPQEALDRITACADRAVLDDWLDRSLTASTVDELFLDGDTDAKPPSHLDLVYAEATQRLYAARRATEHAEGLAEARAEDILRILDQRWPEVAPEVRHRISSCRDVDVLSTWFDRAIKALTSKDLFRDPEG